MQQLVSAHIKLMLFIQGLTHADSAHTHTHTHMYTVLWNTHVLVCSPIDSKFKKVPAQKIGMLYCLESNIHSVSTTKLLMINTQNNWFNVHIKQL